MNAQEFIKLYSNTPSNEAVINLFTNPEWSKEVTVPILLEKLQALEDACVVSTWTAMMKLALKQEFRPRLIELATIHPGCTDLVVTILQRNGY